MAAPAGALANQIPGAAYAGTTTGGGTIAFSVSADVNAITGLTATGVPGDTCMFDGDALSYSWTASNGTIQGSGPSATRTRPISFGQPADGEVTVTVGDGRGGSDVHVFQSARPAMRRGDRAEGPGPGRGSEGGA